MSIDQLCTCTCIWNLQSLCRSPYEYFYGVILTPKQTIRIIINSSPIIIEKDYNYNAISTVWDEYFFSHLAEGKVHSFLAIKSDSECLHLSTVNICLCSPVVQFCNFGLQLIHRLLYIYSCLFQKFRANLLKSTQTVPMCTNGSHF